MSRGSDIASTELRQVAVVRGTAEVSGPSCQCCLLSVDGWSIGGSVVAVGASTGGQ